MPPKKQCELLLNHVEFWQIIRQLANAGTRTETLINVRHYELINELMNHRRKQQ